MARNKARKVRAPPETVTLEGVDENGDETEVTWKIYALEGDELLKVEEFDEDEDSKEILRYMLYTTLKKDDPDIRKEDVLEFDWPFLEDFLKAIGEVNDMPDFFDEEEIRNELQKRQ